MKARIALIDNYDSYPPSSIHRHIEISKDNTWDVNTRNYYLVRLEPLRNILNQIDTIVGNHLNQSRQST